MKYLTIQANDYTKVYGKSGALTIRLMDGTTPLSNLSVVFTIHGVNYTKVTDSNGYASLNINLSPGSYPCTINFFGTSAYYESSVQVLVRVIRDKNLTTESHTDYFEVNKVKLYVLTSNGFDVKPGQNISETTLLHDDDHYNSPTFYFNSGFDGDEFDVSVVLRESDFYNGQQVMSLLNGWNKMNTVVSVVTDAMVISNGKYTMQIKDKKQTNKLNSVWKLRFKQYYENQESFESMYDLKVASYSSADQLLLRQTEGITNTSSKDVINALNRKLMEYGYPFYDTVTDYTPQTMYNLFRFQCTYMNNERKNGVADYDTILSLVNVNRV